MANNIELMDRHLNNAAIYTANENFKEAFSVYRQVTAENPDELRGWREWLDCCYRRIESERCMFYEEGLYDVRTMKEIFERALGLATPEEQNALQKTWDEFWVNTADAAWAGSLSLFSVAPSDYACNAPFERFARDLSLVGEMHPHVAEVIAEGCQLADRLTEANVCFWQVEHLTVGPRERVFQMELGVDSSRPVKGTCYDWFLLRPEFGTRLFLVLGKMCLSRLEDPAGQAPAAGLMVYLTRPIPMDDIKIKEFRQYAQWRWNATKHCPFCGTKLVGMFTRTCIGCGRDVKKKKEK